MFQIPDLLTMAGALSSNAATRLSAIAQNVANADTPGYLAKDGPAFADSYAGDGALQLARTRAGHFGPASGGEQTALSARAGGHMSPNGNNVSLEDEMMRAAQIRQDNDLALTVYKTSLNILRASLGRR
jgi:flagellar basal-body rod protein FlgB